MTSAKNISTAFILCGGLGTRLKPYTDHYPKPMMPCNDKPFLHHVMAQLASQGITKFVLATGYLKEKIREYFNDGAAFGWTIEYSEGADDWETGRRLWEAKELLPPEFLLIYGDNFTVFDLDRSLQSFQGDVDLTLLVTTNDQGEYKTSGNVNMRDDGTVEEYAKSPDSDGFDHVEIGYMLVNRDRLWKEFQDKDCNLSVLLTSLSQNGYVNAVLASAPYYWMTDPVSWKQTEEYLIKVSAI